MKKSILITLFALMALFTQAQTNRYLKMSDTLTVTPPTIITKSALTTALKTKANDADVIHKYGNEVISGVKSFNSDAIFLNGSGRFSVVNGINSTYIEAPALTVNYNDEYTMQMRFNTLIFAQTYNGKKKQLIFGAGFEDNIDISLPTKSGKLSLQGEDPILVAPNGSSFKLSVSNTGTLSVVAL